MTTIYKDFLAASAQRRERAYELRQSDPKHWTFGRIGAELGITRQAATQLYEKAVRERETA